MGIDITSSTNLKPTKTETQKLGRKTQNALELAHCCATELICLVYSIAAMLCALLYHFATLPQRSYASITARHIKYVAVGSDRTARDAPCHGSTLLT